MRRSLYLKDDDYRLSFLYGNFTTLTRFTEADLERVVDQRLSPLYVSIHATDPEVRSRMLRNRRGAVSLRWLRLLLDHGIEVHGQVVVCPGVNDGAVLHDTLAGMLDRFPELVTVAVVPLGVSRYSNEPAMRAHTPEEARATVETVAEWQRTLRSRRRPPPRVGVGRVLPARGRGRFLRPAEYEGFPQHENGVGMVRAFEAGLRSPAPATAPAAAGHGGAPGRTGFFAWVEGAPAEGYRAPRTSRVELLRPPARGPAGRSPSRSSPGAYGDLVLRPCSTAAGFDDVARPGCPKRLLRRQHRRRRSHDRRRPRPDARRRVRRRAATCCRTSACRRAGSSTGRAVEDLRTTGRGRRRPTGASLRRALEASR